MEIGTISEAMRPPTHPESRVTKNHARTEYRSIWKMLLSPTRRAAYSVCPPAIAFHTRTIAMHRARPTMMSPTRYSGRSGRKIHASANIRNGPRSQFWTKETPMILRFDARRGRSPYRTRARGGYIIQIRPIAIGIDTPDHVDESSQVGTPGTSAPIPTPRAI